MWIDTNDCNQSYHEIIQDENDEWICIHADESPCEAAEWGGKVWES